VVAKVSSLVVRKADFYPDEVSSFRGAYQFGRKIDGPYVCFCLRA
jgi:hypothetical protein